MLLVVGLIFVVLHPPARTKLGPRPEISSVPTLEFTAPKWMHTTDVGQAGKLGNSGDHNPLPPTSGELAPVSKLNLAPPRLPDGRPHPLPEQVTVFAADAPELTRPVSELGLPWMKEKDNSAGTGKHGIGIGEHFGMGDNGDGGSGVGKDGIYGGTVATKVVCHYCPDPLYSDEARKQKLQGTIMMRVLVGTDGRAHHVQITRGLGLGLDENAVSAVRVWQFIPAKDAVQRPVASWITVETVFRLY